MGYDELFEMNSLMGDLVRDQFQACKVLRQDWNPAAFIRDIEEMREWRNAGDDDDCFEHSLRLLHLVSYRRVAGMLALKVTGLHLPAELVEMVQDCICSDEELCASSDNA